MRTIRPWKIFSQLGSDNRVEMVIPTIPGTESLTVFALETQLLIAVARIAKARTILEIGTSMGYTALHLAMNTEAVIKAMDIADKPQAWEGTRYESRICRVFGTTQISSPCPADMVFIDADHSYEWVKRDTEFALRCSPSVIAWHDYGTPTEPGVEQYLKEFSATRNIVHVEDSRLVFWFREEQCQPARS